MNLKQKWISLLNRLPYIKELHQERMSFKKNSCFPPGHFYSTIISVEEIKHRQDKIWFNEKFDGIQGINLHADKQVDLVREFEKYYSEIPFTEFKNEKNRYYFENGFYSYTDAIFLHSMIRHFCPKQIIEIGSGFSSSVMLDTNELFFKNSINLTFIEPYSDRLKSLLKASDNIATTLIEKKVQDVSLETFEKLNNGDFLFIDSSHVVKTGSDVHYILFEILPRLKSGVLIHFHDIFYPFEYPKDWVFMGRNWNEDYFLKAFLMYNNEFEIKLFSDYLHKHYQDAFKNMPLCYKNSGGNLWMLKK
jgi:predicted O-methyltransferase YrrM